MPENPNSECSIAASRFEATVLTIGDELSRGEIVDSNAAFLGAELTALGVYVRRRVGCNDQLADIVSTLREAAETSSVVVVSGVGSNQR